ncbi:protein kinase domain-containing protein [Sinimarinibacterium flocculans]|uniref:protein kinase domain-containing protein n=1 Tax=Sinimarinibacterium flocculans TaxID=985250 RepID=UPI0035141C5A
MDPDRWQRLQTALTAIVDRPAQDRASLIERICADDADLRSELESLLREWDADPDFLERGSGLAPDHLAEAAGGDPLIGEIVGAWTIVRRIDRGGMGSVYLAERRGDDFHRHAAIKVIARGMDSEAVLARFETERRILAALDHPNIASVIDGGLTADGRPWFAMPYLEGAQPLDAYCDERRLTLTERIGLLRQVCAAVQFAHQNLIVHRDLKPANILVTPQGVPMLLDFGIAKLLDQPSGVTTGAATRLFTPQYASPEQRSGDAITTASDVYQLGILCYRLFCGERPFDETPASEAALRRPSECVSAEAARLRRETPDGLRRQLRGDLDTICLHALNLEPQRRYRSAEGLADDLDLHLRGLPVYARPDTFAYRAGKFLGRNRWSASFAAALFVVAIGFGVFASVTAARIGEQAEAVRAERDRAQATARFLTELFTQADPTRAERDYTAGEMLERGLSLLEADTALRDAERAAVLTVVGGVYQVRGDYERARTALTEAVGLSRRGGAEGEPYAGSLLELAKVEYRLDNYAASEQLAREALGVFDSLAEVGPDARASALNQIAIALSEQDRLDEATVLLEQVVALRRQLPGAATDQDLAANLNNLALNYVALRRFDRAETAFDASLAIVERRYGPVHPYGAFLRRARAALHEDRGDTDAMRRDLQEALDIGMSTLGEDHPFVLDVTQQLEQVAMEGDTP